eukprot:scaffold106569_cov31-Tisochrysis_lutea.AAC.3
MPRHLRTHPTHPLRRRPDRALEKRGSSWPHHAARGARKPPAGVGPKSACLSYSARSEREAAVRTLPSELQTKPQAGRAAAATAARRAPCQSFSWHSREPAK